MPVLYLLFGILVIMISCTTTKLESSTKLPPPNKSSVSGGTVSRENGFFFVQQGLKGVYLFLDSQVQRDSTLDSNGIQVEEYSSKQFIFSAVNDQEKWSAYSGKKVVIFDGLSPVCEGTLEKPKLLGTGAPFGLIDGGPHSDTFEKLGVDLETVHQLSETEFRSAIPLADFWKRMLVRPSAFVSGCKINKISRFLWAQEKPKSASNFGLHVKGEEMEEISRGVYSEVQHWLVDESLKIIKHHEKNYPSSTHYAKTRVEEGIRGFSAQSFLSNLKSKTSNSVYVGKDLFLTFTIENPLSVNECATENLSQLWKRTEGKWKLLYSIAQFGGDIIILGDLDEDNNVEFVIQGIEKDILARVTEVGVVIIKEFKRKVYFQEC